MIGSPAVPGSAVASAEAKAKVDNRPPYGWAITVSVRIWVWAVVAPRIVPVAPPWVVVKAEAEAPAATPATAIIATAVISTAVISTTVISTAVIAPAVIAGESATAAAESAAAPDTTDAAVDASATATGSTASSVATTSALGHG
jgi:hypothetical protein